MNINLNLATRPYIELRSVYARLRVFAVGLIVLALPMLLVVHTEENKARLAEARVSQLESNIALLRRQQTQARELAVEGPNASVLTEAAFLNSLFRRKAFSWTATMSDLEETLPYGVQVEFIDPVVASDGRVTIRMRVSGAREHAVEVVRNLEHSRHFVAPRLVSEALANQANTPRQPLPVNVPGGVPGNLPGVTNEVAFDILAGYRPLPNSHDNAGARAARIASAAPATSTAHRAGGRQAQLTNPNPDSASTFVARAKARRTGPLPAVKPFAGVPAPPRDGGPR